MLLGCGYVNLLNKKYNILYEKIGLQSLFVAKVISKAEEKEYTDCYTIEVINIEGKKQYKGTKLLLYVTRTKNNLKCQYGDYIQLKGDYEKASSQKNYGGFDYHEYLKKDGVYGIVKAKYQDIKLLKRESSTIFRIRESIIQHVEEMLSEDSANLLLGILLGQKEKIKEEYVEYFRKSSLAHILCVSGAHISYIILGITYVLNKSNLYKKQREFITILILLFFLFLTGFSPSVARAVFMASLLLISKIFNRKIDMINSICLSVLFLLVINPFYLQDIGMALSYGGTIGIIVFVKHMKSFLDKWIPDKKYFKRMKEVLSISMSAQILILPINVYFFNTVNLLFFIGNILASPILGAIIILGFFNLILSYIVFPISKIVAVVLDGLLQALIFISKTSSRNPIFKYNSDNT